MLYVTGDVIPPIEFIEARDHDKSRAEWVWKNWSSLFRALLATYHGSEAPFEVRCLLRYMERLEMLPWGEDMEYLEGTDQRRIWRAARGLKDFYRHLRDMLKERGLQPIGSAFEDALEPNVGYRHYLLQGLRGDLAVYSSYNTEPPHWEVSIDASTKEAQSLWVHALEGTRIPGTEISNSTGEYWIVYRAVAAKTSGDLGKLAQDLIGAMDQLVKDVAPILNEARPNP